MRLPTIQPRHAAILLSLQPSVDERLRLDWSAAFATQENEFEHVELHATPPGQLPSSLRGTLFKNGPARFSRGDDTYAHWLDGDGYVTALRLDGGNASWSGRYVRTEAFAEEEEAGKVTYRTTFGTQRSGGPLANALDIRLKSPANTNVLPLATGSLLALWEAGPPYELDAATLRCVGASDLGGRLTLSATHGALPGTTGAPPLDRLLDGMGLLPLTDALSAHPRHDAAGVVVAWAWRQELVGDAIEVALHTLPEEGGDAGGGEGGGRGAGAGTEASSPVRGRLERTAFAPHDMGLSGRFALFLTAPTRVDVLPFIAGLRGPAQCATFDRAAIIGGGQEGATVHAVCRQGGGTSRYSLAEPYHAVHHANAWEGADGATTHLLCSCWPPAEVRRLAAAGRDLLGSWEELQSGDFSGVPTTHLTHVVLDHASRRATARPFLAGCAQLDHPQVHPHFEGLPTRYVYASMGAAGESSPDGSGGERAAPPRPIQSFVVVDVSDEGGGRIVDRWHAGARRFVDEAAIVPRERRADGRAGAAAAERDAWLVAPIFDGATNTTSYVVLDAADLAAGPVCELPLPTHIPWGLHGAWLPPGGGVKL